MKERCKERVREKAREREKERERERERERHTHRHTLVFPIHARKNVTHMRSIRPFFVCLLALKAASITQVLCSFSWCMHPYPFIRNARFALNFKAHYLAQYFRKSDAKSPFVFSLGPNGSSSSSNERERMRER
jgi:hypothetical protein